MTDSCGTLYYAAPEVLRGCCARKMLGASTKLLGDNDSTKMLVCTCLHIFFCGKVRTGFKFCRK